MKNSLIFATLLGALALSACDEGDIIERKPEVQTSGKVAKLTAYVTGVDSWSSPYSLVLAGFAENSDYAVIQKPLPNISAGNVTTTLRIGDDHISTIELCVTNRLGQRILSFASASAGQIQGDTLHLEVGTVNVGMYKSIQDRVFTITCARCHGLGNTPAGNLTLTGNESYASLVNHEARRPENGIRVVPGDADASLLHKVIHGDADSGINFDHSNMIKESSIITLIDNWISAGAKP